MSYSNIFTQVVSFILDSAKRFFDAALNSWSWIGLFFIAQFVLTRCINFIKRFFK